MLSEVRTAAARTHAPSGPRPSKHAEALQWSRFAEASLERLGGQPSLDAERLLHLGMLKLDDVADVLAQKGNALVALHRDEEALSVLRRALAIREKLLGPDHPAVASTVRSIGFALMNQGKALEAIPVLKQSLALEEKALGPDHPDVAMALAGAGDAYVELHQPEQAIPLLERALRITDAKDADPA